MAKLLKLRRGTTTQHASFTGAEGEVTVDITKDTAVIHDGAQAGGRPLAREDMSNVSSASIAGQLGTDSIATTKIAAGALPTDVTVASANIVDGTIVSADIADGTIVNADISGSAAIDASKISGLTLDKIYEGDSKVEVVDTGSNSYVSTVIDGTETIRTHSGQTTINYARIGANWDKTNTAVGTGIAIGDAGNSHDMIASSATNGIDIQSNASVSIGQNGFPNQNYAGFNTSGCNFFVGGNVKLQVHSTAVETYLPFLPNVDSNTALGSSTKRWQNIYTDAVNVAGEIVSAGTNSINTSVDQKIILEGSTSPYIRFREGTTDKAYIQWDAGGGEFIIVNQESGDYFRVGSGSSGLKYAWDGNSSTVYHSGNDGSGSGLDADLLDGVQASSFLRSDAADTCTSTIGFSGGAGAVTISANSDLRLSNGNWSGDTTKLQHHSNWLYITGGSDGHIFRDTSGHNNLTIDSSGNGTFIGNVTAYSDARLKTDVHTINDALGICGKLRGVSYKWIKDGKPSIGVIAQEVEEVIPEVVLTNVDTDPNTGEETEVKSVDYGKIVGVLINAINELKAEIDELKGGK